MPVNSLRNPFSVQNDRIPLVGNHTNRLAAATKDQVFYNVIPESLMNPVSQQKHVWLNKRGGLTANTTVVGGGGAARAIFYWAATGKVYSIVDDKLYSNTSSIQTLTTTTGTCWITEFLGTSGKFLCVCDGSKMYRVSTADAMTTVTDVDLPSTNATPIFFDSYIFIVKPATPFIYNSDTDDFTLWTSTSFLSAEQYSDDVLALIRQVNYVVAFGPYSLEFFYDAANASGSPLTRQESVSVKVGLAARDTVQQVDKRIFWVGQTQTGDPSVWTIDGLTSAEVSTEFIRKILVNEGSTLSTATSFMISHKGHTLYGINLTSRTIVYDCNEKIWTDWSINSASSHAVLPFKYWTEGANNTILALHNTDGKIYKLDPTIHTDDAGGILVDVITDRVDYNSMTWKKQISLTLVSDAQTSGTVTVSWTDDDYQNYRNSRTFDLTTGRAYTKAGGVFRRRAFRLQHSANTPFRAEALEMDYQLGIN